MTPRYDQTPANAVTADQPDSQRLLFHDDFISGFDTVSRWNLLEDGGFCADDGRVSVSGGGLRVAPPTLNASTGEPAFTKAEVGHLSHLKWMATSTQTFAAGGTMRFTFRAGVRCFGVNNHPYGSSVIDPDADIRLAAGTLNVLDFASGVVFDFWISNTAIYPFYERLKFPGDPRSYHTFASVGSPVARQPDDMHDFVITFDSAAGTATWEVNGLVVGKVTQIGPPDPVWTMVINHGGTGESTTPHWFNLGLGLMTLLDASLPPSEAGLIDVGTVHVPGKEFRGGPHLFGQGVELRVEHVSVDRS